MPTLNSARSHHLPWVLCEKETWPGVLPSVSAGQAAVVCMNATQKQYLVLKCLLNLYISTSKITLLNKKTLNSDTIPTILLVYVPCTQVVIKSVLTAAAAEMASWPALHSVLSVDRAACMAASVPLASCTGLQGVEWRALFSVVFSGKKEVQWRTDTVWISVKQAMEADMK